MAIVHSDANIDEGAGVGVDTVTVNGKLRQVFSLGSPDSAGEAQIASVDAAFGVDVDVTRLPALPTGANTIGTVNLGTVGTVATQATLASVLGVLGTTADLAQVDPAQDASLKALLAGVLTELLTKARLTTASAGVITGQYNPGTTLAAGALFPVLIGGMNYLTPNQTQIAMVNPDGSIEVAQASLRSDRDQPSVGTRNTGGAKMGGVAAGAKQALISAAGTNATSVTTVPTSLYGIQVYNQTENDIWLKLYDKASAPTVGTDVPAKILCIPGAPSAGKGAGNNPTFCSQGAAFDVGMAYALTTGPLLADVTGVGAGDVILNLDFDNVPDA